MPTDHPPTTTTGGEGEKERARYEVDLPAQPTTDGGAPALSSSRGCDGRREAIVRLLVTRDDGLPLPTRKTPEASGFVSGVRERSCPDCLANGAILRGCSTCGGSGWVSSGSSRIAAPDAVAGDGGRTDPYASEVVLPFGFDYTRHDGVRDRDGMIDRLAEQVRPPRSEAELLEEANARPFGWEVERARMWREFDYGPLDACLELLRMVDPAASRAVHAVFVYGWVAEGPSVAVAERGLDFLEERMPETIRAPRPAASSVNVGARGRGADVRALGQRDGEIRRLVLVEGVAAAVVAARFGLSVAQVNRVVAREP